MAENDNQKPNNNPNKDNNNKFNFGNVGLLVVACLFILAIIYSVNGCGTQSKEIEYTMGMKFISDINDEYNVTKVVATPAKDSGVAESYTVYLYLNSEKTATYYFYINNSEIYSDLVSLCDSKDILFTYKPGSTFNIWGVLFYGFMAVGAVVLFVIILRTTKRTGNDMSSTMDFTKSRAKLNKMTGTKFSDVAGLEEEKEELKEIVDFLKNPKKYQDMGARVPKGVLLYGKPGTGKTLLARAVAGEAGVPFFYTTGSDFVEMFVGVGASRVRDMFKTAKKHSPSILFMDEIDAIGRQRGTGLGGGNDEREQTLNQILVEMDGFGQNTNVIIIGATNRVDILDPALLRPGRFDRQINVSAPDVKGREEILKVHSRNKKLASNVDLKQVAHETPGFTGADLENVMNESALLAARENKTEIEPSIIEEAIDRVMMGPSKKSRIISQKEKELTAYHEAGHCVVGTLLSNADIVEKVTIIPRGEAGGYNLMGPKEEEQYNYTRSQLLEKITGYLGGRTAEELIFGEISTGASNDMENATSIARRMVCEFGMSKLGPITYEKSGGYSYLGRDYSSGKNFSDQVAHEIDVEIRSIIDECHNNAAKVLQENIDKLKLIAFYLLKVETLVKADIEEIFTTGKLKRADEESTLNNLGTEAIEPYQVNDSENQNTNNEE